MKKIRIGTRDSALALWQARKVATALEKLSIPSELVEVKSAGDLDLHTPLNQFGSTGIFTKILDDALYRGEIDLAVHSLKDYPTQAPDGIIMAAVLERGSVHDVLVYKRNLDFLNSEQAKVATGSIRRVAQWKSRYPRHENPNLRGNVQTRLSKLEQGDWNGAIFAQAGLERLGLLPKNHLVLNWMIPAPAQGIIGISCLEKDQESQRILQKINHQETALRAKLERDFLWRVEGGCSAPVGAYAEIKGSKLSLECAVFSLDGKEKVIVQNTVPLNAAADLGIKLADEALHQGAAAIMDKLNDD